MVTKDDIYEKLASVLDTLPSGFPRTERGTEIELLKKLFTPGEAELFCDLRLSFETADEIARRTGRPLEGLEESLSEMWRKGLVRGVDSGKLKRFKMVPWIVGIYEYQYKNVDRAFWNLYQKYGFTYAKQLFTGRPQVTQILPIEETIRPEHEVVPYEQISTIIQNSKSFMVVDCICRKERQMAGKGCEHPLDICLLVSDEAEEFNERNPWTGRRINKQEAHELMRRAEELGLVHNASNTQKGHVFICSCCGCGCGTLMLLKKSIIPASQLVNAHYYAEIDPALCNGCALCAETRCQVNAIEKVGDVYRIRRTQCIGCGLCVSACPTEAVRLVRKPPEEQAVPPEDESKWNEQRAAARGVDYGRYK